MSTFLLIVLIATAGTIQYRLDVHNITKAASQRGWSAAQVTWTIWARGAWLRSRWERSYWLRYRDQNGRLERCLCHVASPFDGPFGVSLEPASVDARESGTPALRVGRVGFVTLSAVVGVSLGAALGIGGSLLLFPSSNIAPAYGLFVMVPVGLCTGVLFGVLRKR